MRPEPVPSKQHELVIIDFESSLDLVVLPHTLELSGDEEVADTYEGRRRQQARAEVRRAQGAGSGHGTERRDRNSR